MNKLVKWWLIGILVFLPFQLRIADIDILGRNLFSFVRYLDEVTIVVFMPIACYHLYQKRSEYHKSLFIPLIAMVIFCIVAVLSGMINHNALHVTLLGTFDYIKNFLVIYIFVILLSGDDAVKLSYRAVFVSALFLGYVGLVQELWALFGRYIVGLDLMDGRLYLLANKAIVRPDEIAKWGTDAIWRFGIFRAHSLFIFTTSFGLYSVLILALYMSISERTNIFYFLPLFTGVLVSVSRMSYLCFILLACIQVYRGKKWMLAPSFLLLILLVRMTSLPDSILPDTLSSGLDKFDTFISEPDHYQRDWYYRTHTRDIAADIFKKHPVWGAGPGMFGGVISVLFNSPVYEQYGILPKWLNFLREIRSIDQFWPQLLAETGLLGALSFGTILLALSCVLFFLKRRARSHNESGLFAGLLVSTSFIVIYTLGSGLNNTAFLFTFSALAGIGMRSCESAANK